MKLIVTIDTEEDNWGGYRDDRFTVKNIGRIQALQDMFDSYLVRPTYLVSYPVATDDNAVALLKAILDDGRCEIGTHCHPWSTPPVDEKKDARHSMLCNLAPELQMKKIGRLHEVIRDRFGVTPISFRAGRWGFSREVAETIHRYGYKVDTSVTPFIDWSRSFGPDFSECLPDVYRFSPDDIRKKSPRGELLEVPATIGFLQENFALADRIQKRFRKTGVNGVLDRLGIINKVWLSPEMSDGPRMIRLVKRFMANGYEFVNLTFHSPSLMAGLTPFVKTESDERRFLRRIKECLVYLRDAGVESITLSDTLQWVPREP